MGLEHGKIHTSLLLLRISIFLTLSYITLSKSIIQMLPGFPGDLPFKFETGYIGVGESEEVQLFYYFLESERNPTNDPLVIFLTGGPGCASLSSFFYEMGPLTFKNETPSGIPVLELNPYSWAKVANILFIDQPVGTGFSYATDGEAYSSGDTLAASQSHEFLKKWLKVHPEFIPNVLYVSGTSYTGVIVPLIIQKIYDGNEAQDEPLINVEGYMIGNGLTDKDTMLNSRVEYANRMALLSDDLYESAKANCHSEYTKVVPDNIPCRNDLQDIDKCVEKIHLPQILEPFCVDPTRYGGIPVNLPHLPQKQWCRADNYVYSILWANDESVQKALGVRKGTIKEWVRCNGTLSYDGNHETSPYLFDVISSVKYHKSLTNKLCRALIFSGDHDMVVPHIDTEKWIRSLNLTVRSRWEPWFVEDQIAGYVTAYSHKVYSLTYATIKGAGHTSSEYKPKEALAMVERWLAYRPLSSTIAASMSSTT